MRSADRVDRSPVDRPELGVTVGSHQGAGVRATLDDLGSDKSRGFHALTFQRGDAPYTARLLELVARSDGVRPVLRKALPHLVAQLGAERGAVLIWRDEPPNLEVVGSTDTSSRLVSELIRLDTREVAALRALIEAQQAPVMLGRGVARVELPPAVLDAGASVDGRHILLPIGRDDDSLGLLVAGSSNTTWPDLAQLQSADAEITVIAAVLSLRRRLESTSAERAAATHDQAALLDLWQADSLADLMQRVVRVITEIAGARTSAAGLVSDGTLVYRDAIVDGRAEPVTIRYRRGQHPQGQVLDTAQMQVHPTGGRPRACVCPVLDEHSHVRAVFEVHAPPRQLLRADVPARLRQLSVGVAAILRRLEQLDSVRHDLATHDDLLPAVRGLAGADNADAVYAVLDQAGRTVFGAAAAWLVLPPTGKSNEWQAWTTQPHLRDLAAGDVPLCTIPDAVMREVVDVPEATFTIDDTLDSPLGLARVAAGHGLGSLLGLRIPGDPDLAGVLCLGWSEAARPDPAHVARLQLLRDDVRAAVLRVGGEAPATPAEAGHISRLQVLGTIASGVAHGLNNAIGGILGHVDLAFSRESVEDIRNDLRWVKSSAEQAAETLRRVQIATGVSVASERRQLEVNMLAVSAVAIAQQAWTQRAGDSAGNLIFETDLRADQPILGNVEQLEEVLQNLISNAAEAMEGTGTITVATWSTDDRSYIQVRDTGPGIPSAVRDQLFDPFVSTKAGAGRGLGLAIAAGIVHAHGGDISLETSEGAGTQFTIGLPMGHAAEPVSEPGPPDEPAVGLRIMLVEDEPSVRVAAVEMLMRAGHEVVACVDGPNALEAFEPERFDLVISDLGLPLMSGWDLIERIHERDPDVPSMVMTGYGEKPDVVRQAQLGVRVVLAKPFVGHDLTEAVQRTLRANGRAQRT